jgi:hypothetical protein
MSPAKTTLKGVKKTVCALLSEQEHPTKSQKSFTYVLTLFTVEFCHQPFHYDLAGQRSSTSCPLFWIYLFNHAANKTRIRKE